MPFSKLKVGELIELKEDSQYQTLVDRKLIEESEAPKVEALSPIIGTYSTENIVEKTEKVKKEVKK